MTLRNKRSRAGSWLRDYGWVAYWLAFAAFTLNAARNPGFVMNPDEVPYPWGAALGTVALLGLQTAGLNATLRPLSTNRSWRRVAGASALAFLFARQPSHRVLGQARLLLRSGAVRAH